MKTRTVNPATVPAAEGGYTNALELTGHERLLFISGQIPVTADGGAVPEGAEAQADLIWQHIDAILREAGMTAANLVKVTTFLGDRADAAANTAARQRYLGEHRPALSVIVTGIFDPVWRLEIEAIGAA